jgi:hypothetical protein
VKERPLEDKTIEGKMKYKSEENIEIGERISAEAANIASGASRQQKRQDI